MREREERKGKKKEGERRRVVDGGKIGEEIVQGDRRERG